MKEYNVEAMLDELIEEIKEEEMGEMYEMEEDMDEEMDMITLSMEDGSEVPCLVLGIVEVEGQDYIALLPADEEMLERGEGVGFIFRYFEGEDGAPILEGIEDDEEFAMVSAVLDEVMEITVEEENEE